MKDNNRAIYWLEKAAHQGLPQAQYEYGNFFKAGVGVNQDMDKAFYWWERAARQGYEKAAQALLEEE